MKYASDFRIKLYNLNSLLHLDLKIGTANFESIQFISEMIGLSGVSLLLFFCCCKMTNFKNVIEDKAVRNFVEKNEKKSKLYVK